MNLSKKLEAKTEKLICGVDEAGRGPVFGPLLICGACFYESDIKALKLHGVKDSKKVNPNKRVKLSALIRNKICQSFKAIIVSVKEIDAREEKRITMNRLEEIKMAEVLNELQPDEIYIDAADVDENRFGKSIEALLTYTPEKVISKHRADDIYPVVSAASIIAKVIRDAEIEKLKQKYGEVGSGYPSDTVTIDFLRDYIKKNGIAPPFARKTWETTKKIINTEVGSKKITDFF